MLAFTSTKKYVLKILVAISGAIIAIFYIALAIFPFVQHGGLSICIEDMEVIRLSIIEYRKINNEYPKEDELKTALDLFFMSNKRYPPERSHDLKGKISLYKYNLEDPENVNKWLIIDKNRMIHCGAINTMFPNGNRKTSYSNCKNIEKLIWLFKLMTSKNLWYYATKDSSFKCTTEK